ncbi:fatty acid hydroxylase [Roseateles aquatilis]|uniref:Fatty acid hydroxylase n=1 Tax=Roseateles aquatilis TaxID=431061 RepID=A0A246J4L6_9BURK|nr:sterol desaturase family protein [Roseateles aquatilis]OWQ87537.1 fatty acid hydroxylase [Roseateles aquatilis]
MHRALLIALPVFALSMAFEWLWGRFKKRDNYSLADTISSLSQGLLSLAVAAITPLFQNGIYALVQPRIGLIPESAWSAPWGWVAAIVIYDFCDYWLHRVSHESALFWAAHTVHHQSEHFNLSTALRQESFYAVMGWPFFLPMALLGIPLEHYAVAGLFVLLYQFWIHTEHIGRLGWLDRIFSTPSNHRVHHAVNPRYLDKNYGAVLVIWDRMFGSFEEESEPCVYGTVTPLRSWNPIWAVGQFYAELFRRMRATPRTVDKLRVLFKAPGWSPPGAPAAHEPDGDRLAQAPFDPPVARADRWRAVALFIVTAAVSGAWLAADDLPWGLDLLAAGVVAAGLYGVGALLARGQRD